MQVHASEPRWQAQDDGHLAAALAEHQTSCRWRDDTRERGSALAMRTIS